MIKTIDINYYNFKPKSDKVKTLFLLAILLSCPLLVHAVSAEGVEAVSKQDKSLESSALTAFFGIFIFPSSDTMTSSQPTVSIPDTITPNSNTTTTASNNTGDWLGQLDPFTPQNAYTTFVSQVNQTVQAIFLGQFNYTEQKTNEGLAAMNQVLQNGGSAEQAREAFIQNASTSKSDITTVNNNLNVQYGKANSTVQAEFDKDGNLR